MKQDAQMIVSLLISTKAGQRRIQEPIENYSEADTVIDTLRKRANKLGLGIPRNALKPLAIDCSIRFRGGSASTLLCAE